MRAAKLIASGDSDHIAAWFSKPTASLAGQLSAIASQIGGLTEISEAKHPFEGRTIRRSVMPVPHASTYSFIGTWVTAKSDRLGTIQLQASAEPGPSCKLLALHVDTLVVK